MNVSRHFELSEFLPKKKYKELEKKVDHSAGLKLNGALSIAENQGRWQELKRQATTAQLYDVDVQILEKNQIKKDTKSPKSSRKPSKKTPKKTNSKTENNAEISNSDKDSYSAIENSDEKAS